jgi:hypothetical protein
MPMHRGIMFTLAFPLIASGFFLSSMMELVSAAERPHETEILDALKPSTITRGLSAPAAGEARTAIASLSLTRPTELERQEAGREAARREAVSKRESRPAPPRRQARFARPPPSRARADAATPARWRGGVGTTVGIGF